MMKKLLTFLIGLCLIATVMAQGGPPVPSPVKILVSVNGQGIYFDDTKVTNLGTGEVLTKSDVGSLRVEKGGAFFDLSNFKEGVETTGRRYAGDVIEIQACNVHPDCKTSFTVDSLLPRTVKISIVDDTIPEKVIYTIKCWDGSIVSTESQCPVQPTPEPEVITDTKVIETEKVVTVKESVTDWETVLIGMIASIIAIFAWGKGFAGLIRYYLRKAAQARKDGDYELAKKYKDRAEKMAKTVVTNFMAGKYKK